jgi:hypothetical protein
MKRAALLGFLTLAISCSAADLDGEFWQTLQPINKAAWLNGFVVGTTTAHGSTGVVCLEVMPQQVEPCMKKAGDAINLAFPITASKASVGTLQAGIDAFYTDYKNRKIALWGAANYAAYAIQGASVSSLERMAERLRSQAAN